MAACDEWRCRPRRSGLGQRDESAARSTHSRSRQNRSRRLGHVAVKQTTQLPPSVRQQGGAAIQPARCGERHRLALPGRSRSCPSRKYNVRCPLSLPFTFFSHSIFTHQVAVDDWDTCWPCGRTGRLGILSAGNWRVFLVWPRSSSPSTTSTGRPAFTMRIFRRLKQKSRFGLNRFLGLNGFGSLPDPRPGVRGTPAAPPLGGPLVCRLDFILWIGHQSVCAFGHVPMNRSVSRFRPFTSDAGTSRGELPAKCCELAGTLRGVGCDAALPLVAVSPTSTNRTEACSRHKAMRESKMLAVPFPTPRATRSRTDGLGGASEIGQSHQAEGAEPDVRKVAAGGRAQGGWEIA